MPSRIRLLEHQEPAWVRSYLGPLPAPGDEGVAFDEAATAFRQPMKTAAAAKRLLFLISTRDNCCRAEVVRDLDRNASQPDQSFSERQMYGAVMNRLAAELAALERIGKATAAQKLLDFLKAIA